MQKVLTAEQMREVDRLTTERYGIPSILLMENAAHAVSRVIIEKFGGSVDGRSVSILCGKGNNGGDGAALARQLWTLGADVYVYLFGSVNETSGDARINFEAIKAIDRRDPLFSPYLFLYEVEEIDAASSLRILRSHVIVDAIFGTGLSRPIPQYMREPFIQFSTCRRRGTTKALFVSVDIPSGLSSDSAGDFDAAFVPDITVTFTSPKPGNVLASNGSRNGELVVSQIGSPYELLDKTPSSLYLAEEMDAGEWLRASKFTSDSYKNKRGHAVLIAGSEDYTGAAVMAGNSAIRSGVGLVTLATPKSCQQAVAARVLPEVIVRGIAENSDGAISNDAFDENAEIFEKADAIAIGCGLSATDPGVEKLFREIIELRDKPVIVDAGALWFLSPPEGVPVRKKDRDVTDNDQDRNANSVSEKGGAGWEPAFPLILTPHEGEFLRLLGTQDKDVIKDRVAAVRDYAVKNNVILVLKGERVLIGEPGGKVVVNPTGNSGLGKAGNGDTLTGILAGFIAQAAAMKIDIFNTVVAAVYVAGMAGDIAERKYGKRVMTASDVRECLADVFIELQAKN